jgi:Kef-type K+ transport system membrane component KefB
MPLPLSPVLLFLIQSIIVVAAPYALWRCAPLHRAVPLVVVQILVGVALGPTLLGRVAPEAWALLFPPASLVNLRGLVWLSILLFAFLTGLHFDLATLRERSCSFVATSLSSVLVPTVLGAAAGWGIAAWLPEAMGAAAERGTFAVGMGIAAGVTALPVLGSILRELNMLDNRAGVLALGCAAVNDAALWVMAAGLLAVVGGRSGGHGLVVLAGLAGYGAVLWGVIRPLMRGLLAHAIEQGQLNQRELVAVCSLLLLSAAATEALGIHAMVGAFAFGAVLPRAVAKDLVARFDSLVVFVLMPFFFISTGLATSFDPGSAGVAGVFLVMTAVSVLGKLAGTALPLRLCGKAPWSTALVVGAFMQCKGLMEIVVLTMLLDARIISPACFSAMIGMALVTTAVTKPLVGWWRR